MANPIKILIDAEMTGGAGIKDQIRDLRELHDISAQFESLRNEAAEKYPEDLKRQNNYIREQINLQQRLETVGSRGRIANMRRSLESPMGVYDREQVKRRISSEQRAHIQAARDTVESQAARTQWAEDRGIGDPRDRDGGGFADDFLYAGAGGFRQGGMGMLAVGLGRFGRRAAGLMTGMGVGAKLAAGTGIGLAVYGAYKAVQFVGQGISKNRELAPEFTGLMAGMDEIPEGADAMKIFRREVELSGLAIGKNVQETIALQREWMRLGGTAELAGSKMERTILTAYAYGIDAQMTTQFAETMARTGYQPNATMSEEMLSRAIMRAEDAGMGKRRIQEFLGTIQGITPEILRTAVTTDPKEIIAIAAQFAELGLPFQGERGTNVLGKLHRGLAESPMGFMAAKRAIEARGGVADIVSIEYQRGEGLSDYQNLKQLWGIYMEQAGGDEGRAALLMRKAPGMGNLSMKELWNPDEDNIIDSIGELMRTDRTQWDVLSPEEYTKREAEMDERIDEITRTTGFMSLQNQIITEIGKIENAAELFAKGVDAFHTVITEFGEEYLNRAPREESPVKYQATIDRLSEMGYYY